MTSDHDADGSSRLSFVEGAILCLTAALCPVVYSFQMVSFLHAKEAVLWLGVAALSIVRVRRGVSRRAMAAFGPLWALLGFSLVVHVALRRSAIPTDAAASLARGAMILAGGVLAWDHISSPAWRRRVLDAIGFSAGAAAVLALIQYADLAPRLFPVFEGNSQRMYSVFGNQDLLGGYLACVAPLLAYPFLAGESRRAFSARNVWSLATFAVLAAALVLSGSRSAWIAGAAGIIAVLRIRHGRPVRRAVLAVLGVGAVILAVLADPEYFGERAGSAARLDGTGIRARLWFWDGTQRMIRDHLVYGVGPGNFAYWSPRYLGEALSAPDGARHFHNELHTRYAHSDPLQLAAETGLVGIALLAWFVVRLPRRREAETGALIGLGVFSLFNFPFHSAPHAFVGVVCAGMLMSRPDPAQAEDVSGGRRHGRAPGLLVASVVVLTAGFLFWAETWPSVLLRRADRIYLSGGDALPAYERVCRHPWPNAAARRNYGIALLAAGCYEDAEREFSAARDGLDTGELYLALGALAELRDDHDRATWALEECVHRTPSSVEAWRRLLRLADKEKAPDLLERAKQYLSEEAFADLIELPADHDS